MEKIKRHRRKGGFHKQASDEELAEAFDTGVGDPLEHLNLVLVKNKPGGVNLGNGIALARYADYGGDAETAHLEFFGTDFTCRVDEVEVVQKVAAVWV